MCIKRTKNINGPKLNRQLKPKQLQLASTLRLHLTRGFNNFPFFLPFCSLLVMSRDSQAGKESRTQRNTDNPTSGRSEGDKAAHNDQEEVIQIPENKVGIVIGKKGWRRNDIKERSGVQALDIEDCQVRITGTEEQRTKAKTLIYRILNVRHGKCPFHHSFIFIHPLLVFISTCLPV